MTLTRVGENSDAELWHHHPLEMKWWSEDLAADGEQDVGTFTRYRKMESLRAFWLVCKNCTDESFDAQDSANNLVCKKWEGVEVNLCIRIVSNICVIIMKVTKYI